MVSNIVYVIFAFLLIIIAFMNIIGRWDQWELKQALPKFVIWVLIVPFSWLFVQFVIAISSFLSVSVLMLPYDVLSNSPKSGWNDISKKPVCTTYIVISKEKTTNDKEVNKNQCWWETTVWELLTSNGIYWLLNIYTYGIFSIDDLSKINGEEISTFSSLFKISMNLLLVLLLAIVYFILMVSLFLALFVRWVWLWMYMVFSPVFGLLFFFGKSKENGFMDGKFSISEFISLAMVPVYVSAALAFWLVFIFVAGTSFSEKGDSSGFIDFKEVTSEDYKSSTWSTFTAEAGKGTRITVLWKFQLDMYGDISTSGSQTDGLFEVMKSGFWTLLMQLFGLAVLWVAVMTAINQSKITQAVVEPIAGFGKQVGGLIQKAPQYAPVFWGQSMTSLKSAASDISWDLQSIQSKKWVAFADKHFWEMLWNESNKKIKTIATWNIWTAESAMRVHDQLMWELKSAQDIVNTPVAHRKLWEIYDKLLKEWRITESWREAVEKFKNAKNQVEIKEALHEIDKHWQAWFTILAGEDIAKVWDMDEVIAQFKPQDREINVDKKLTISNANKTINWETIEFFKVLWIDINLTSDWKVNESDAQRFINKFQDEWLIGKITEADFKQKLWQTRIKDEKAIDDFIEYISQFIDAKTNKYIKEWNQSKDKSKLFKDEN